ncbi:hypothetical protein [Gottfriedia luciferensis]|nr:hypothetical protein [Gottfriedia luciferensis]
MNKRSLTKQICYTFWSVFAAYLVYLLFGKEENPDIRLHSSL